MKKEYTYQFAFWCFALAALLILFTVFTSCSPKILIMPQAPVHPEQPSWGISKEKYDDPIPQKTNDEKDNH